MNLAGPPPPSRVRARGWLKRKSYQSYATRVRGGASSGIGGSRRRRLASQTARGRRCALKTTSSTRRQSAPFSRHCWYPRSTRAPGRRRRSAASAALGRRLLRRRGGGAQVAPGASSTKPPRRRRRRRRRRRVVAPRRVGAHLGAREVAARQRPRRLQPPRQPRRCGSGHTRGRARASRCPRRAAPTAPSRRTRTCSSARCRSRHLRPRLLRRAELRLDAVGRHRARSAVQPLPRIASTAFSAARAPPRARSLVALRLRRLRRRAVRPNKAAAGFAAAPARVVVGGPRVRRLVLRLRRRRRGVGGGREGVGEEAMVPVVVVRLIFLGAPLKLWW